MESSVLKILEVQPNHHWFNGLVYEFHHFLQWVYHHPKGTTISKMVVDFQGIHQPTMDFCLFFSVPHLHRHLFKNLVTTTIKHGRFHGHLGPTPRAASCTARLCCSSRGAKGSELKQWSKKKPSLFPRHQSSYGGFLKWWYPTTMGFPTKNDHVGVFWGYDHLRKHPYSQMMSKGCPITERHRSFRFQETISQVRWAIGSRKVYTSKRR